MDSILFHPLRSLKQNDLHPYDTKFHKASRLLHLRRSHSRLIPMNFTSIYLICSALVVSTSLGAPGQYATATWLCSDENTHPDGTIRTIIKMNVDEGWHTYWKNPGEGGLPLSIEATLPKGWSIGEILYPVPKRFKSGELPGFGYEGEVVFPISLTPPAEYGGELPPLKATLSWLTCNDETCVPGKANLTLPSKTDPEKISKAYDNLPKLVPGANLTVEEDGASLKLTLKLPEEWNVDISEFEVFPVTQNVIDSAADFHFRNEADILKSWTATVPKSEYFDKLPEKLTLLLADRDGTAWLISTPPRPVPDGQG